MKLKDYRETYYTLSGKASDVARQMALAGIALVWIFKAERGGPLDVPVQLLVPAQLFVAALALDLLQYFLGSAIWGTFSRYHERRGTSEEQELSAPAALNWPAFACYWSKAITVVVGYVLTFSYIQSLLPK